MGASGISSPWDIFSVSNHADLYGIGERGDELAAQLRECRLHTDGLFNNADAGFDTTVPSWKGWNYLAFDVVYFKKFTNHKSLNELYVEIY